jgi:SEL1 protein
MTESSSSHSTETNQKRNTDPISAAPKKPFSLSEFIHNFLEADAAAYYDTLNAQDHAEPFAGDAPGHEWDTSVGVGPDGLPGDEYDDIDEGILESLIILGLAGLLAWLVWYRNQRTERRRREADERARHGGVVAEPAAGPGQQADGGFFPPPNDPNFNDWAAGGVGH